VMFGLFLSTKLSQSWIPAPIAYGLHEFLSILTLLFMSTHALVLLADSYIDFKLWHLVLPFTAPYEPLWTGLGTLALYLATVITGSFYIRKQIGQRTWRILHYLTFITYLLALGHGLMAGTDSPLLTLKLLYGSTGLGVLFLVYYRFLRLKLR
jgi:methionine sulfoxide reductase heme-binding subunit